MVHVFTLKVDAVPGHVLGSYFLILLDIFDSFAVRQMNTEGVKGLLKETVTHNKDKIKLGSIQMVGEGGWSLGYFIGGIFLDCGVFAQKKHVLAQKIRIGKLLNLIKILNYNKY